MGLSGLCLVHCLVLPILASAAPLLGPIADAQWVHELLVLCALPVSIYALARTHPMPVRVVFLAMFAVGATLLIVGAFVAALREHEVLLTVGGALILAAAHLWRWRSHQS